MTGSRDQGFHRPTLLRWHYRGSVDCNVIELRPKLPEESTYLETALCAEVDLNVDKGAIVLAPFEGVSRVAVLMLVTGRSSTVREEDHQLMNGLRILGSVVL